MISVGELLAVCREVKGLTLREVEEATGISNAFLSQLENGKVSDMSFRRAVILCDFYRIPVERLAQKVREEGTP